MLRDFNKHTRWQIQQKIIISSHVVGTVLKQPHALPCTHTITHLHTQMNLHMHTRIYFPHAHTLSSPPPPLTPPSSPSPPPLSSSWSPPPTTPTCPRSARPLSRRLHRHSCSRNRPPSAPPARSSCPCTRSGLHSRHAGWLRPWWIKMIDKE